MGLSHPVALSKILPFKKTNRDSNCTSIHLSFVDPERYDALKIAQTISNSLQRWNELSFEGKINSCIEGDGLLLSHLLALTEKELILQPVILQSEALCSAMFSSAPVANITLDVLVQKALIELNSNFAYRTVDIFVPRMVTKDFEKNLKDYNLDPMWKLCFSQKRSFMPALNQLSYCDVSTQVLLESLHTLSEEVTHPKHKVYGPGAPASLESNLLASIALSKNLPQRNIIELLETDDMAIIGSALQNQNIEIGTLVTYANKGLPFARFLALNERRRESLQEHLMTAYSIDIKSLPENWIPKVLGWS